MQRMIAAISVALCLATAGWAQLESEPLIDSPAFRLGVQVFSGFDMPVIQDDVGSGPIFGVAARANVWRFVHGELFFRGTSQGDVDETLEFGDGIPDETVTYKGGSLTGFGLNVLLARQLPANVWPYFLFGLSTNSLRPGEDSKEDENLFGWSFGGGTGINLYNRALYLDLNTSLLVMPFHDGDATRKNWQTRLGLQYFIPVGQQ